MEDIVIQRHSEIKLQHFNRAECHSLTEQAKKCHSLTEQTPVA